MPADGAYFNTLRNMFLDWLPEYRQKVIAQLEKGGVYATKELTPDEQVQRFMEMQPQDYQVLIMRLMQRYKGLPDAQFRINKDLSTYISRMVQLMSARGLMPESEFNAQLGAIQSQLGV